MPVETRAQIKAREAAAQGPAARAGARSTSSRIKAVKDTTGGEVPASPAAKKAVAAKKASASAAKKPVKSTKGGKKTAAKPKKSAFDNIADELGSTLPKTDAEEFEAIVIRAPGLGGGVGSPGGHQAAAKAENKASPKAAVTAKNDEVRNVSPEAISTQQTIQTQETEGEHDLTGSEDEDDEGGIGLVPDNTSGTWVDPYPDLSPAERAETISGYVCYRTDYSHSPTEWGKYKGIIMDGFKKEETRHGKDVSSLEITWMEDESRFGGNNITEVRKAFDEWCLLHNRHAPYPSSDPFGQGRYQDFTTNFCLAADTTSIASVLANSSTTEAPGHSAPTILVVDRHYHPEIHAQEVTDAGDEADGAAHEAKGGDPREADADLVELGEKIVWKGYQGSFRAAVDEWMNVESEAQPERGLPSFWMQYFAKYASKRASGWDLASCGVME